MALRIGVDLDGVLADMEGALARHASALFGRSAMPSSTDGTSVVSIRSLTMGQRKRLWRHVRGVEGFWESLDEVEPGTVAQLAALATKRRWEVLFLTRRHATAGATAQVQSQRWLQARGFSLPSVYVVKGSRGKIAEALGLDVIVDDTLENCLDVLADSKTRVVGVVRDSGRPPGAFKHPAIQIARSSGECLNLLCEMDTPTEQRGGGIRRVLRLLGLKTSIDRS